MISNQRRRHYAWVIAAVTFFVLLAAAGVRSTPGVLILPLGQEFGWDRSTISAALSVNLLMYGLVGPFAAAIMGRLGIRRTVLFALVAVALGVLLSTGITAPWQLTALWGFVIGTSSGVVAMVLAATVVNRWFAARQGLVMGVLAASNAAGQLVFLPLLASVIQKSGWRPAVLVIAGAVLLIIPVVLRFLRDSPAELGLRPYGDLSTAPPVPEAAPTANLAHDAMRALREGLPSRNFWLLAGSFFVCGASTNGLVGTHLIAACADQGIPEVRAAGLLALMGVFNIIGTTVSGWLSDRLDNRVLLSWYYGLRGLSLIYFPFGLAEASWGLTVVTIFYGLDWIATVPPTVRLTGDAFGKARAGIMFGWIIAAHQCGAAIAALGAGAISAWSGSYERAFLTSGAICLLTAAMVLQIRRAGATPPAVKEERTPALPVEASYQAEPAG